MVGGVIIKGVGGFYDVSVGKDLIRCRGRGRLRKLGLTPMVGDFVHISPGSSTVEGAIDEILPRKNILIRPAVANIDYLAIVISPFSPEPDYLLVDKLMICSEKQEISPILVLNKTDLASDEDINRIMDIYKSTGYPIYKVSGKHGIGLEALAEGLKDGITTLAGQSGVGKSSIINKLHPSMNLEVGGISERVQRGKHTTRHVELLALPLGGMIVDTPGFSNMDLSNIPVNDLQYFYPEFLCYLQQCRFKGCIHRHEPDCAIKSKVSEGLIDPGRYERYLKFLEDIEGDRRDLW